MEYKGTLEKRNKRWVYDNEFLEWLVEISCNYTGYVTLARDLGIDGGVIRRIVANNRLQMNYKVNKYAADYKAIYQDYDWCYQHYVVERMDYRDMAKIANCSARVIQKWCSEKHRINRFTLKELLHLNDKQRELITISTLGDGCISYHDGTYYFIVCHAENQKDYLYWKYDLLKNLCNQEPSVVDNGYTTFGEINYSCQKIYRVSTRSVNDLKEIKHMSIKDKISQMTSFQLAIYLLDDASYGGGSWTLCFAKFNTEEKQYFVQVCQERFGLYAKIHKDDRYVGFDVRSSEKINKIILDNIPNELDIIQYKIIKKQHDKHVLYTRIIDENNNIMGISTYYRNIRQMSKITPIRQYMLKHELDYISLDKLHEIEKELNIYE